MAVPCMPADVLLWRGQILLVLATASADQISFNAWRHRSAAYGEAGTLSAAVWHWVGRAGLRGMSLWASDSSCWRAGVAPCRCPARPGLRAGRSTGTGPASAVKPTRRLSRWVSFRQAVAGVCCAPNADSARPETGQIVG